MNMDLIRRQTILSWKKLRLHLGMLTKEPYKLLLPEEVVEVLEWWKKKWEEMDKEVMER